MVIFGTTLPVTVVRRGGTGEEVRWETKMGGDFDTKALFNSADEVITRDAIYCEALDEPRIVLRVKPVFASGTIAYREVQMIRQSEWDRLYDGNHVRGNPLSPSFQPYPKCRYHWTKEPRTVQNWDEEMRLRDGWGDSPNEFAPYKLPRHRSEDCDPCKWIDDWKLDGLSEKYREMVKAKLLNADSAFWDAPNADSACVTAMKLAFTGIAEVLFDSSLLTKELLTGEITTVVWDAAISAGWYRYASETPQSIFPERIGHYSLWKDESTDWNAVFRSGVAAWLARLLEGSTGEPRLDTDSSRSGPKAAPQASMKGVGASGASPQQSGLKGDITLLQKSDGTLFGSVDFPKAEVYAGISERRRQQLLSEGLLLTSGKGNNRRITVDSLLAFCPPVEDPK